MANLTDEIRAYEAMRGKLESEHLGEWALVYNEQLVATFKSLEEAAEQAVQRFGRGPYLIRQIGSPPLTLPASVLYHSAYANDPVRME